MTTENTLVELDEVTKRFGDLTAVGGVLTSVALMGFFLFRVL